MKRSVLWRALIIAAVTVGGIIIIIIRAPIPAPVWSANTATKIIPGAL